MQWNSHGMFIPHLYKVQIGFLDWWTPLEIIQCSRHLLSCDSAFFITEFPRSLCLAPASLQIGKEQKEKVQCFLPIWAGRDSYCFCPGSIGEL